MQWARLLCPERERPSTSHAETDLRTAFEKDYHRIIGSASFRRLQDKTQVFPLDQSDFVRTRLTHSLEVSSFAHSLGNSIGEKIIKEGLDPDFTEKDKADMSTILQCAGLIHDIGNPPFGHFGERAIRRWFEYHLPELTYQGRPLRDCLSEQMQQDFYHFEGNAQALRLVTKLHYLFDEHGMNLTYGLLSALIKYPASSLEVDPDADDIRVQKMGYYTAEQDLFERIQEATGTKGCRNPLAFILEAADDIAYRTVDIEDAFVKGFITYELLLDEVSRLPVIAIGTNRFDPAGVLEGLFRQAQDKGVTNPEEYAVKNWIVRAQNTLITCAVYSFAEHYQELMEGTCRHDLFSGSTGEQLAELLGDVAYTHVFSSRPICRLQKSEEVMIDYLLDHFVRAVLEPDAAGQAEEDYLLAHIPSVSDNYVRAYMFWSKDLPENDKLYLRLMLVTDYVCGMTDSYAERLYKELNG